MVSSLWVGLCPGEGKGVTRGGLDAGVGLLQHVWVKPRLAGGQGLPCRQRMTQIPSPVDGQHRCAGITCSIGEQADSRRGKGVSRERCYSGRLTYAGLEPGLATAAEGCRS